MTVRARMIAMVAAIAGACAVLPSVAPAQAPTSSPIPMPAETVNLTMEQKHVIKEIIIKDLKTPATASAPENSKPGDVVPNGIALQPLPVEVAAKVPQVRTHSFFIAGDKVVIVDPKDNKVSTVVE
jgi:hypothetical protein